MEDKGETKAMEVEAKVVFMVVAPMQPDAPGFSTLPALSPPDSTDSEPSATKTQMERQEVDLGPLSNARCFILSDVFTPTECARLIHAAERAAAATTNDGQDGGGGWEKLSRLFASEYRGGDRLLVMDEPLADNLWQRIKPGLTRDDVLRVRPIGFGNAGTWRPFRLNECLKLVRYKPGDHFSGHVDGPWVPKLDESSIYTVIVYLNDDYKGGCTNFRSENTKELLWRVTPRAGQALIFNHDTYHEGEPVLEGVKYILRTEMMFQRVDTGAVVARDDYLAKPTYRKLVKVYEKSNDAIDQGDVQVFVEKYLQAIQLQRDEQRSLGEDKRQLASELELPYEIYIKIFAHLSPTEIARLQLVSKLWYDLARDGPLWKKLYQARWRSLSPTGPSELQPQVSNAEIEDWYGCWKTRTSYERATHSTVVAVDCGGHSIKCARTTTSPGTYQTLSDRSVITTIREHAWHYRAPVRHYYGEAGLRERGGQVTWLARRGNVLLMSTVTSMVMHCLERLAVFNPSPIVFCVPPTWDKEWTLLPRAVQRLESPYLCAEDSGVLVLASYGKRTGIVVDVGFEVISISPVHEGKLLRQFVALSRRTSSQAPPTAALVWAYDSDDEPQCPSCLRSFTLLVRRHHCRMCGVVRCGKCIVRTTDTKICERCQGDAPKPHQAPPTSKPDQWEEEQDTAASAAADGADSPSRESYKVAASLLTSVLRRLHRHQNGPQLNLIDLDSLRHNVVITGGGSMEADWDADFECELGRLAGEQPTPSHTLHQVDPARKEQRAFDAAQGACMMVEARSQAPFDNIFQHVTIKTPTA